MKENDEITGLFRNRLTHLEMTVRDGFWEELQDSLPKKRFVLTSQFYRMVSAAAVVFVLGVTAAVFWYFSPKKDIQEAFTKVATLTPEGSLNGDATQEKFSSILETEPSTYKPESENPEQVSSASALVNDKEDESMSVTVSITFTQHVFGNQHQAGNGMYGQKTSSQSENDYYQTTKSTSTASDKGMTVHSENVLPDKVVVNSNRKWAMEVGVGTSLPKGDFGMPFKVEASAERYLNKSLSLEAGLQYNRIDANRVIHTLAVPVKLNAVLASNPKVDLYATLGGAAEKCIAGAKDNSFDSEPVQLSVAAGLGVRYKLNDRMALFAEPTVSHHFDTDSQTKSLYTERPVNFNLLCGVRMTY